MSSNPNNYSPLNEQQKMAENMGWPKGVPYNVSIENTRYYDQKTIKKLHQFWAKHNPQVASAFAGFHGLRDIKPEKSNKEEKSDKKNSQGTEMYPNTIVNLPPQTSASQPMQPQIPPQVAVTPSGVVTSNTLDPIQNYLSVVRAYDTYRHMEDPQQSVLDILAWQAAKMGADIQKSLGIGPGWNQQTQPTVLGVNGQPINMASNYDPIRQRMDYFATQALNANNAQQINLDPRMNPALYTNKVQQMRTPTPVPDNLYDAVDQYMHNPPKNQGIMYPPTAIMQPFNMPPTAGPYSQPMSVD